MSMDNSKKLTLPENVYDALVGSYKNGFLLIGKCPNGQIRKFLVNPDDNQYFEKMFELADYVDNEGNLNIQTEDDDDKPEFS